MTATTIPVRINRSYTAYHTGMRLLIAAMIVANIGCAASPTEPSSSASLRFGQHADLAGVRIAFADINDSRCPKQVVCAWAGDAAVRLESGTAYIVLHTNPQAGSATGTLNGVTITLLDVRPEPITSDGVRKSDYVVTLRTSE